MITKMIATMTITMTTNKFHHLMTEELGRSRLVWPNFHSGHEALGVIREEYKEFEDEIFKKRPNPEDILHELVQIAANCQRAAEDLKLIADKESE